VRVRYAAVVLAGGAGRRVGGAGKPALQVAGRPMVHRVLAAVADATPRVVVGPAGLPLPPGTVRIQEEPPGGGPVPAAAAGLAEVGPDVDRVALLAADLPLLTVAAIATLRAAVADSDGAVFVDSAGQRQWLCGVWRTWPLRRTLTAALAATPTGGSLRAALGGLVVTEVCAAVPAERGLPPWFDCDTEDDLRVVERWTDGDAG
jgi:molybdenum cofactor guanylyltransferase